MRYHSLAKLNYTGKNKEKQASLTYLGWFVMSFHSTQNSSGPWNIKGENKAGSYPTTRVQQSPIFQQRESLSLKLDFDFDLVLVISNQGLRRKRLAFIEFLVVLSKSQLSKCRVSRETHNVLACSMTAPLCCTQNWPPVPKTFHLFAQTCACINIVRTKMRKEMIIKLINRLQ